MDISEVNEQIERLEAEPASWANLQKLAWLYIVKDHFDDSGEMVTASGSEFLDTCNNVKTAELLPILDEHFKAIKALYPSEYNLIIDRINNIRIY